MREEIGHLTRTPLHRIHSHRSYKICRDISTTTYTEFSLIELLFREPGCVVPRAEILEQLWGYPPRRAADLRVVDVYVARLRGKLEPDPRNPELILTVRGTGYASQRVGEMSLAAGA